MRCLCLLFLVVVSVCGQFEVPDARVEVLHPKGLKISIPDVEGIKLFAIHANVNKEIGREGGQFSRDVVTVKDGRWTFFDPDARLKIGDVLNFWTYVDWFDGERKLGYPRDGQSYTVQEYTGACTKTDTVVQGYSGELCKGKLIFNENFATLNNSLWTREIKFADAPDYEFVVYGNDAKTLFVKNDRLTIRPTATDSVYGVGVTDSRLDLGSICTDPVKTNCLRETGAQFIVSPVASAQITTKGKFSFTYGKIEVRARLPKGDWLYPEIYLNPQEPQYGDDYLSGQIRIAFTDGNKINLLHGGVVLGDGDKVRTYGMKRHPQHTRDFHNYGVVWTPTNITLTIDDAVYGTIKPPKNGFGAVKGLLTANGDGAWDSGSDLAPFDQNMYITLGVGAGGHNFPDSANKPWKNLEPLGQYKFYDNWSKIYETWTKNRILEVDHVKVWAL